MSKLVERSRPPRVMLVEDCDGDVLLFRRALARVRPNTDLIIAQRAEAALGLLQNAAEAPDEPLPDLIVTDLNLPGMSGIDLIGVLKRDPRFRRIPCIMMTTSSAPSDIEAAYDAHASGYLTKPDSMEDYAALVETMTSYWFGLMQVPLASATERAIFRHRAGPHDMPH